MVRNCASISSRKRSMPICHLRSMGNSRKSIRDRPARQFICAVSSESNPATVRGVEHAHIIDIVAHDSQTGETALIMLEPRAWDGSELRLYQLQEKINAYLSFALDGELAEVYPRSAR